MPASPPDLPPSTVHLPPGPWASVLDALCARFPAIERATWRERMARGRVCDADGRPLDPAAPHRAGLRVHYHREVAAEPLVPGELRVLHVDADLVVVDKPPFLPVTPAGPYLEQTALRRLARQLDCPALAPLHRIDRLTRGLVMFSVRPATRDAYQALFRERRIAKAYEALAAPLPGLAFPLVRRTRIVAGEPFFRMRELPGEPNSETRIEVIARAGPLWRYRLAPLTGRKHQLRVQMAGLGAAIANDPLYPVLQPPAPDDPARPLALLARELAFVDPLSGAPRRFVSTLDLAPTPDVPEPESR